MLAAAVAVSVPVPVPVVPADVAADTPVVAAGICGTSAATAAAAASEVAAGRVVPAVSELVPIGVLATPVSGGFLQRLTLR